MTETNRRLVLAERPTGNVDDSTVRLEEEEAPQPGDGEALVRNRFLSIDPTIRTWMDDAPGTCPPAGRCEAVGPNPFPANRPALPPWNGRPPGYLPPIGIGEVIRCGAVGEVVSSNSDNYAEGALVFGMNGWQDYAIADEAERTMQV